MQAPILTLRLQTIADIIRPCRTVADIGTDHAYLPAYLVASGICERAVASDVQKGPLARADATVRRYHLEEKIECRLGSGLSTLSPKEADAIVIAGMGGELIARLIDEKPSIAENTGQLILQPMTALPKLRSHLNQNGFAVSFETLVREGTKLYHIMEIKKTADILPPLSDVETEIGAYLIAHPPKEFEAHVKSRLRKLSVTANGLTRSKSQGAGEQRQKCLLLIEKIKKETGINR